MQFKRQFQPDYKGSPTKNTTGEKITVPDEHLTIQQLLLNHTRGIPMNVASRNAQYFGDRPIRPIDDLTDIDQRRRDLLEEQEKTKKQVNHEIHKKNLEKEEQKKKEKILKQEQEEFEQFKKSKQKKTAD